MSPCRAALTAFALLCAGASAAAPPGVTAAARGNVPPPGLTAPAQAQYMLNCMGCHLADGAGSPGKVPSVRDSLAKLAASPAGRRYLIQVPGAAQSRLSDGELAQVLTWMVRNLSAQGVPGGFADFSAAEVAAYRRTPLIDVRAARAQLLNGPP
jgi:mono/diheme cytochrome c family protein